MKPTCVLYLDGQLDAQRAAELSAHAAVCGECGRCSARSKEESRLLGHALLEQDEPLPMRLREAPVRAGIAGVDLGFWALLGMGALVRLGRGGGAGIVDRVLQPWTEQLDQVGFQSSSLLSTAVFQRSFLGRMGIHV